MNAIEAFAEYAKKCGITDLVDGFTLILFGSKQIALKDLRDGDRDKTCVGYYVNLEYPFKVWEKERQEHNEWEIKPTENGVFFIKGGAVIMFVPIGGLHVVKRRGMLVSASGHETVAVVSLLQIENSYTYYTR